MKRFTFLMLSFLLASITVFGQERQAIKLPADMQSANEQKSEWYGHSGIASLMPLAPGYEYAIRDTANVAPVGSDITTVKFYNDHENYGYPSVDYNIKIYEDASFDSETGMSDPSASGTAVYTQSYTAIATGMQEVELTTPYTVSSGEYWVAIENAHATDTAAMFMGGLDATTNGQYVMLYNYSGTDYWLNIALMDGIHPATLSFYYDDGGVYEETSDIEPSFLDVYPDPTSNISELTISETEDLVLYPIITNNGPDATSENMTYSATINGNELIAATEFDLTTNPLENGYYTPIILPDGAYTITAAELDALTLPATFDVCFTSTYAGTDPAEGNNTACITVTRGEIAETTCDLEAVFMTSNTDPTPIAPTMSITPTEDITLFPGVNNLGPDEANTTASVVFTVDGNELLSQSIDMTGLPSGSFSPLTGSGYPISADDMNTMGLSGTFDVCMTVTYDGIDNVATNNESCITITREPVSINSNISETMVIYPNPANNVLNIENAQGAKVSVYNMIGQELLSANVNNNMHAINVSELPEGSYIVRIANGAEIKTQKFNIVR
ncbi:MAG: T9SS type A sorting domain-containing protein [Bacteroidales bacterium]|jgi:hypothetical protein|nr:T9SS type A sorting domain-containing protein [Bacteroidales bacterium]